MEAIEFRRIVGIALKRARHRAGLSQNALADITNSSRGFISEVETGEKGLSLRKFFSLSAALELDDSHDFFDDLAKRIERYED